MAEKPPPPVPLVTPQATLSPRLCALADALVPQIAALVIEIPHPPVDQREFLCAIRVLMGTLPKGAVCPPDLDNIDRTTVLRVIALAALALRVGAGRDTGDPDTARPERIA